MFFSKVAALYVITVLCASASVRLEMDMLCLLLSEKDLTDVTASEIRNFALVCYKKVVSVQSWLTTLFLFCKLVSTLWGELFLVAA
jgi:hypothetical protein